MQKVSLMGLGTTGAGMAGQLLKAGFPLTVWNRSRARAAALADEGASIAASPRAAAEASDVIISMVSDDEASRQVWLGEEGVLAGVKPGAVLIESSTLSPAWVRQLAAAASEHGCGFLDAPVTGSKMQAANGELLFLVGGESPVLDCVLPVLQAMSRDVMHLGPVGSGALMKLVNNFLCGVQAAAFGEALALIEKSGLDREQAIAVLLNGAPGSPLVKAMAFRMAPRDYTVNFALELMQKDLSYALAEAEQHSASMNMAAAAHQLLATANEQGWGKHDFSALIEPLRS